MAQNLDLRWILAPAPRPKHVSNPEYRNICHTSAPRAATVKAANGENMRSAAPHVTATHRLLPCPCKCCALRLTVRQPVRLTGCWLCFMLTARRLTAMVVKFNMRLTLKDKLIKSIKSTPGQVLPTSSKLVLPRFMPCIQWATSIDLGGWSPYSLYREKLFLKSK